MSYKVIERIETGPNSEFTFERESWFEYRKVTGRLAQYFQHRVMRKCRTLEQARSILEYLNDTYACEGNMFYIQYPQFAINRINKERKHNEKRNHSSNATAA